MTKEKFENHKNSLRLKKIQTPLTLASQFWLYHREISSQQYHFNRQQVEASILKSLKQNELLEFFEVTKVFFIFNRKRLSIIKHFS